MAHQPEHMVPPIGGIGVGGVRIRVNLGHAGLDQVSRQAAQAQTQEHDREEYKRFPVRPGIQRFAAVQETFQEHRRNAGHGEQRQGLYTVGGAQEKPKEQQRQAEEIPPLFLLRPPARKLHDAHHQGQPDREEQHTQTVVDDMPPEKLPQFRAGGQGHEHPRHGQARRANAPTHLAQELVQGPSEKQRKHAHAQHVRGHGDPEQGHKGEHQKLPAEGQERRVVKCRGEYRPRFQRRLRPQDRVARIREELHPARPEDIVYDQPPRSRQAQEAGRRREKPLGVPPNRSHQPFGPYPLHFRFHPFPRNQSTSPCSVQ